MLLDIYGINLWRAFCFFFFFFYLEIKIPDDSSVCDLGRRLHLFNLSNIVNEFVGKRSIVCLWRCSSKKKRKKKVTTTSYYEIGRWEHIKSYRRPQSSSIITMSKKSWFWICLENITFFLPFFFLCTFCWFSNPTVIFATWLKCLCLWYSIEKNESERIISNSLLELGILSRL